MSSHVKSKSACTDSPLRLLVRFFGCVTVILCVLLRASAAPPQSPGALPSPARVPAAAPGQPNTDASTPATLPPPFELSPIPLGQYAKVGGAIDLRMRPANTGPYGRGGVWVNSAELDLQREIITRGVPVGDVVIQAITDDPAESPHSRDFQLGEAYFLYRLPIETDTLSTVFLKVGQFQIPFALLAVYDPHLQIVQPLYAESLGLRTDWGAAITGRAGLLQYDFSVTNGTGPNHLDTIPDRLEVFRLGRTFVTRNGTMNIGGSLLSGRLPITDLSTGFPYPFEVSPSGRVNANRSITVAQPGSGPVVEYFLPKSRIAGDATYDFKAVSARGEAMVGADNFNRVQGYYGEAHYAFCRRANVFAAHSLFLYTTGGDSTSTSTSVGLSFTVNRNITLTAVYQDFRDKAPGQDGLLRHELTTQILMRF